MTAYRQAIALDDTDARWHSNLGGALDHTGRYEEAVDAWRQAIALDGTDARCHAALGATLRKMGDFSQATAAFENALRCDPQRAVDHAALGAVYRALGRLQAAAVEQAEAQRLSAAATPYDQACIAALGGDAETALRLLAAALAANEVPREWVRQDPDWEELRGDARFQALTAEPGGGYSGGAASPSIASQ